MLRSQRPDRQRTVVPLCITMLAYIGPGGALTLIGSFVALVASVFFAVVGLVWYPLKRLLLRVRRRDRLTGAADSLPPNP